MKEKRMPEKQKGRVSERKLERTEMGNKLHEKSVG